ncbi:hypothetical protein Gogos_003307 [Gossypium gossypioides]|uniref:Uncharacterized protein n=1 Tax=Gossypium gossypioides TaxID=34282 RepID=A0A7J9CLH9_GOSGO|nr:hypothetical protein [Gossypium gossypioides]
MLDLRIIRKQHISMCKCYGPKCKARDHGTRCTPWRYVDKMGII